MDNRLVSGQKEQLNESPVEQVREILFGAQLKDMEVRFKRQEERFLREINDVKDSLKKRLDSLENFMKSEVSSMFNRLKEEQGEREEVQKAEQKERIEAIKSEQRERAETIQAEQNERVAAIKNEERQRAEAISQLNGDLQNSSDNFERKLAKLSNTMDAAERELRSLLLKESSSLTDKIEDKYADALNVLAKTASQIRSDMVYRTSLSGMMTEVVVNLSKPWNDEEVIDGSEAIPAANEKSRNEEYCGNDDQENNQQSWDDPDQGELPPVIQLGSADNY